MLVLLMVAAQQGQLPGQACCTLQGFNGNTAAGSISDFDGLDLADQSKHTQLQLQVSGSDDWDSWVSNNSITNGPLLGYSLGLNRFVSRTVILGAAVSGSISSMFEVLSLERSSSEVILNNLNLRSSWISLDRRRSAWLRLTLPFYERYSNENFPFRLSSTQAVELGYAVVRPYTNPRGKPRIVTVRFSGRRDAKTNNLYQFKYYATGQIAWSFRVHSRSIPFVSIFVKQGSLEPLENGLYLSSFPATYFAYGLVGGGAEYKSDNLQNVVIRLYAFYPVLRWSNNRLPAGFEEKPLVGITVTKALSLTKPSTGSLEEGY